MSTTERTVAIVDLQAHLTIVDLRVRTEEVAYYSRAHRAAGASKSRYGTRGTNARSVPFVLGSIPSKIGSNHKA